MVPHTGNTTAVPRQERNSMFIMHDGSLPHVSREARGRLDLAFPNRWIERGVQLPFQRWIPRSPDLNPINRLFRGNLTYANDL